MGSQAWGLKESPIQTLGFQAPSMGASVLPHGNFWVSDVHEMLLSASWPPHAILHELQFPDR